MAQAPLGVTDILNRTFQQYFGNFVPMFAILFVPLVVFSLLTNLALGDYLAQLATMGDDVDPAIFLDYRLGVLGIFGTLVFLLAFAMAVCLALDVTEGEIRGIGDYFQEVLGYIFPIVVLSFAGYLAVGIGFVFLIVPGLYLAAMWSVTFPAMLKEGAGWGALGRSAQLTKDYRWATVGANLVLIVIIMVFSGVASTLTTLDPTFGYTSIFGAIVMSLVNAAVSSVTYGLSAVFIVLLHSRLVNLKEGGGQDSVDVFT